MTTHTNRWTTRDLEQYHDDELNDDLQSALTDDLRCDPLLRERLASVHRVDDQARACLLGHHVAEDRPRTRLVNPKWGLAAAAAILLALTGVWQLSTRSTRWDMTDGSEGPPEKIAYDPVRVVFSIPVPARRVADAGESTNGQTEDRTAAEAARSAADANRVFLTRLDSVLASGRYEETTRLLGGATDDQRSVAYAFLGELLRSADLAERILDQLSPREQLAACEVWARTRGLRAVVFNRLERFSTQPEYAEETRAVVARFNEDPSLRTWVRALQLRT